jgi:polyribonucleotide nucleotidyltransferase
MLDFGAVVEYLEAPGNGTSRIWTCMGTTENVSDVVNMGDVFKWNT